MRRMAGRASFNLDRSMFEGERSLFVGMTPNAACISARCQACLLGLETTVRVVAVGASHRTFQNLMVERLIELVLYLCMARQAELRLTYLQQLNRRDTLFF